ncbi:MAG: hypothetical protein K0S51_1025 [Bacillales bacterium]|nr:hypothetical protein [Bacillales bacterium]
MNIRYITSNQYLKIVIIFIVSYSMFIVPNELFEYAKNDTWICIIIAGFSAVLQILFYHSLTRKFEGKNVVEICEILLGKHIGRLIIFIFFTYFILSSAIVVRRVADFILLIIMPETPIETIILLFILVVLIGGKYGVVTLANSSDIFFNLLTFLFIIVSLLLIPKYEVNRILPAFESNINDIFKGTLSISFFSFLDLIALFMIYPYVKDIKKARKSLLIGASVAYLATLKLILACIMILGVETSERQSFATFALVKMTGQEQQIIRFEVLIAIIWLVSIFFKSVIYFYSAGRCLESIFRIKDYKKMLTPLAVVVYSLSLIISKNTLELDKWLIESGPIFSFSVTILIPLVMYLSYKLQFKKFNNIN